jgi:hypothetical protein
MKITRQLVADKIADYLHGKLSQAELVDWAEQAMMDADFDVGRTAKNFCADSAIARK